mgnify:FL=1
MRIISPIYRVRIGKDTFQTGDGQLIDCSIELSEDDRASRCEFSVFDPGLKIGGRYQKMSLEQGGIQVPPELLAAPQAAAASVSNIPGNSTTFSPGNYSGKGTYSTNLSPYVRAFMDLLASGEVHDKLGIGGYFEGNYGGKFTAESAQNSFPSPPGRGGNIGRYQFNRGDWSDAKKADPNIKGYTPADQDLVCVWKLKYRKCWDLVSRNTNIEEAIFRAALEWESLPPYRIGPQGVYSGGGVKKGPFATVAQAKQYYEERLRFYTTEGKMTMQPTAPPPSPPVVQEVPKQTEVTEKGTEIIIETGFEPDQLQAFHFIHVSTSSKKGGGDKTTFQGQSIRWLLTRKTENSAYKDITLRQLAQMVCRQFNLVLEMEGSGPKYAFLSQDGITAYELLRRCCRSIGFVLQDSGNKLIIKPLRPKFTGFVVTADFLIEAQFDDKARGDRSQPPATPVSSPSQGTSDSKAQIDLASGSIAAKNENKTGSTSGISGAAIPPVAGSPIPQPATKTIENKGDYFVEKDPPDVRESSQGQNEKTVSKTSERRWYKDKLITTITSVVQTTGEKASTVTRRIVKEESLQGTKVTTTIEGGKKKIPPKVDTLPPSKDLAKKLSDFFLKQSATTSFKDAVASGNLDPITMLPAQEIGAIDIADGKAEAKALIDESRRVKGYESSATLITTPETLLIVPGSIIALSGDIFPEPFDREWRVSSVKHSGGKTSLQFYTPQAAKPETSSSNTSTGVTQFPTGSGNLETSNLKPGGFIFPIPKGATTIGDGYGTRAGRAAGYMHKILDITAPQGTPMVAMADAICKVCPNAGGAGNMLIMTHADGYETTFMHIMPGGFLVQDGQPAKQGQAVAKCGTTGMSSGPHLHLRLLKNGQVVLLSQVGMDVLKMGLPIHRYNATCDKY